MRKKAQREGSNEPAYRVHGGSYLYHVLRRSAPPSSRFHKSQKFAFFRTVNHPARMDNMRAQIDRDVPDFLSSGWSARLAF